MKNNTKGAFGSGARNNYRMRKSVSELKWLHTLIQARMPWVVANVHKKARRAAL